MDLVDLINFGDISRKNQLGNWGVNMVVVGECLGSTLICACKYHNHTQSTSIKVWEPISKNIAEEARLGRPLTEKKSLKGWFQKPTPGNEKVSLFKRLYVPGEIFSISFLKSKPCVGCTKGFEVVDLDTLNTQGFLHTH